jgi:hypothetical protein
MGYVTLGVTMVQWDLYMTWVNLKGGWVHILSGISPLSPVKKGLIWHLGKVLNGLKGERSIDCG